MTMKIQYWLVRDMIDRDIDGSKNCDPTRPDPNPPQPDPTHDAIEKSQPDPIRP